MNGSVLTVGTSGAGRLASTVEAASPVGSSIVVRASRSSAAAAVAAVTSGGRSAMRKPPRSRDAAIREWHRDRKRGKLASPPGGGRGARHRRAGEGGPHRERGAAEGTPNRRSAAAAVRRSLARLPRDGSRSTASSHASGALALRSTQPERTSSLAWRRLGRLVPGPIPLGPPSGPSRCPAARKTGRGFRERKKCPWGQPPGSRRWDRRREPLGICTGLGNPGERPVIVLQLRSRIP